MGHQLQTAVVCLIYAISLKNDELCRAFRQQKNWQMLVDATGSNVLIPGRPSSGRERD